MKNFFIILLVLSYLFTSPHMTFSQISEISLQGTWEVELHPTYFGEEVDTIAAKLSGIINLPGSLAEHGLGYPIKKPSKGYLSASPYFIGKAIYRREIDIPENWHDKEVVLFLERVLWSSVIFIDKKKVSYQDALGTPHLHYLGKLKPGKHQLTMIINNDMIHNIGNKGHAYTEHTQSIWNGVVGKISLQAYHTTHITRTRIFSDIDNNILRLEINIKAPKSENLEIAYTIAALKASQPILQGNVSLDVKKGESSFSIPIFVENKLKQWSEFSPAVYILSLQLKKDRLLDKKKIEFGYMAVNRDRKKIHINNKPIFLRGNLDCVHFPLTGYPSCNIEDWLRIFQIYKSYGLNHVRFHSWTPPEAAFQAANRLGIYIQSEIIWIDQWMSEDQIKAGSPDKETKGHPKGLGYVPIRDQFIVNEMHRVVDYYGNHPSFIMFCIGNELGSANFDLAGEWIKQIKEKDPRRLYAVSTARKITPYDDYSATHYVPDLGACRGLQGAKTNWDFQMVYGKAEVPIIAHEIGQWPVYPRWSALNKYTGVLKPLNLKSLKKTAEKNGIVEQDKDFVKASGAFNQIMYKYETESFLRTKDCAGVQLLSMQDYQGQGEALVGWLDCFWDSKGITSSKKFKQHFNTTVPLLRLEKFVWKNDEQFNAQAEVSHYGEQELYVICKWTVSNDKGHIFAEGDFGEIACKTGTVTPLGTITFPLKEFPIPEHFIITITLEETVFRNKWDFWVYSSLAHEIDLQDITVTNTLNEEVLDQLQQGKKVLFIAHKLGHKHNTINGYFFPLYWSFSFFPNQKAQCLGLLVNDQHKALEGFPSSFHSDWQWEAIYKDAKFFILNDLPKDYKPIVQPIDNFHRNHKLGSIFELKVGKGQLLVCGFDLHTNTNPVAITLKNSLIRYMQSEAFNPKQSVSLKWVEEFFSTSNP